MVQGRGIGRVSLDRPRRLELPCNTVRLLLLHGLGSAQAFSDLTAGPRPVPAVICFPSPLIVAIPQLQFAGRPAPPGSPVDHVHR